MLLPGSRTLNFFLTFFSFFFFFVCVVKFSKTWGMRKSSGLESPVSISADRVCPCDWPVLTMPVSLGSHWHFLTVKI